MDGWSISTVVLALLIVAPLAVVVLGLSGAGPRWDHVVSTVLWSYVWNTVILVTAVSVLSFAMAVPAAWLVSAFDFPGRSVFEWALVVPLAIPTYVVAFVYLQVPELAIPVLVEIRATLGVDAFLAAETGLRYGLLSVILAAVLYPYLYLAARASFQQQRRGVIEAAQSLGRRPTNVFFTVALPLARPALVAGLGLVVMEVINDYGAINLFGVPTLTEGIFRTWFGLGDRSSALRIAGLVMAAILIALWIERSQRGHARFAESTGDPHPLLRRPLRGWRGAAGALVCMVPLGLGFIFPVVQLTIWSSATLADVLTADFWAQMGRSVALAAAAAVLLSAIGVLFTYANRLHRSGWLTGASRFATLGYAAPGAVVAVGVMVTFAGFDRLVSTSFTGSSALILSGTVFAVGFAYLVRFLAVADQPIRAGMDRVCGDLDEASRTLGSPPGRTLIRINLPLLRGTLVAATMLVFVDILKELPLTLILRPAGFETLSTTAFGLAKEGRIFESAVPSLIIVIVAGLGLVALNRFMRQTR